MDANTFKYYESVLCLEPIEYDPGYLCSHTKGHTGTCSRFSRLNMFKNNFSTRFTLEASIIEFLSYLEAELDEKDKNKVLACVSFDFLCFAYMLHDAKQYLNWDEEFDTIRKLVFTHVMRVTSELIKINLRLFSNDKKLLCPVLGQPFTISLFVQLLSSCEKFIKPKSILYNDSSVKDYNGPFMIPVTLRGLELVGNHSLVHNNYNQDNWLDQLKRAVEFNSA